MQFTCECLRCHETLVSDEVPITPARWADHFRECKGIPWRHRERVIAYFRKWALEHAIALEDARQLRLFAGEHFVLLARQITIDGKTRINAQYDLEEDRQP